MRFIRTTRTQLDRIKVRAKAIRPQFHRLGHALDAAAKELTYDDYHHAVWCASKTASDRLSGTSSTLLSDEVLALAMARLPAMLRCDPAVDLDAEFVRAAAARSAGLQLSTMLLRATQAEGGRDYFLQAVKDYEAFNAGWSPARQFHVATQREDVYQVWTELLKEKNEPTYDVLHLYAFLHVIASYRAFLAQSKAVDPARQTTEGLVRVLMELLMQTSVQGAYELLHGPIGATSLDRSMNISVHTGEEDFERPSTYWSRASAAVSVEMIGTIAYLPLKTLIEHTSSADPSAPLPFVWLKAPDTEPLRASFLAASRARWSALGRP